jgi:hypothetical protein
VAGVVVKKLLVADDQQESEDEQCNEDRIADHQLHYGQLDAL